ncbi:facilitated trehalose transporter Tret1-like [Sitodiplosis mosellana]|uniref:facilitated trehalose transporter Tret1-like n=1 Tax=Sitodiplosis mosellana TaxID=263140 RepID=UPI002443D3DE|nr:facilitated trehalose transporter Tret1-like [Sitodiplosis mosellana]XP_055320159.1 facilitated trehalose transporter Tret1-like [Sitodiplosis mosellana]XP_055320160.1 facilitated trehalose transporter Tret1-like [Sitodiplosis mosellana]XP_055320161.1 facilitated trehalose transporter Tret1-like [Sitodiplosis mosellana]
MIPSLSFWEKPIARQALLSICIAMSFFYIGLVRGYSAPAVPSIMENDPELLPTKNIASWASSVPPSGAIFGSILAALSLNYLGRRYTIIAASPLATIGWILIATATRYEVVIAARFLNGFCVGLCLPSAQVYIGESVDPKIRGILGSLPSIFMSLAILIAYIIGSLVKWDILAWYCTVMSVVFGMLLFTMPESPVWLRSKKRLKEAEQSEKWLKLTPHTPATNEKTEMEMSHTEKPAIDDNKSKKSIYLTRPIVMPLIIGLSLLVLQQISGIDAIIFFTVEIFRESGSSINSHLATIMVGLVQLVSNIAVLFVVDKSGRKPLLMISAIIMSISMAGMGTAFYLKQQGTESVGWLPLTSLVIYMVGFSVGFGCIPFLLLGELFPVEQRSVLSSIAGSFNLGVMFLVIKTYHYLEHIITTAGTFYMYSVFCALAFIFVIFVVPETKGKDLDDIAKLFVKNRRQSVASNSGAVNKAFNNSGEQYLAVATVMNDTNGLNKQQALAKTVNGINGNGNGNDSDITKL